MPLLKALTAMAALLHDWGKASDHFQEKLRNPRTKEGKSADPLRHEWISVKLIEALVAASGDAADDEAWLSYLLSDKAEEKVLLKRLGEISSSPQGDQFPAKLPPFARMIAWLILSHHRLPVLWDKNERAFYAAGGEAGQTFSAMLRALAAAFRERIGTRPVAVCASTRFYKEQDEAALLLEAWKKYTGDALLVVVPRHPERFQTTFETAQALGYTVQKRSDNLPVSRQTQVWVGDSMGELFAYYLTGSAAFVGGSLVDTGCQNIIEPIACGLPTVFGFSTYHFDQACRSATEAGRAGAVAGVPGQRTAEQQRRELQDGATEPVAGGACETGQVHEGIVPRPDPGAGPPSHLTERLLAAGRRDH